MDKIFYLLFLCNIIWEAYCFAEPKEAFEIKEIAKGTMPETKKGEKRGSMFMIFMFGTFAIFTTFLGIVMSFQWWAFLTYFLYGFALTPLKNGPVKTFIDGFLGVLIILFIVLNGAHFHINIF